MCLDIQIVSVFSLVFCALLGVSCNHCSQPLSNLRLDIGNFFLGTPHRIHGLLLYRSPQGDRQEEVAVKAGNKKKARITSVLTVFANSGKLPPLLVFICQPTPKGWTPAANSIEREFKTYTGNKGHTYPRGVVNADDQKTWHGQQVLSEVWVPQVWRQRPGRQGRLGGYHQPDTLLACDDCAFNKADASKKKVAEANTTLFLIS